MDVEEETKFLRYLHYGSEEGIYTPGCRFYMKSFTPQAIPSFHALVFNGKEKTIIDMMKKVFQEKTSAYPEALIFILAQCAANKNSQYLRQNAYIMAENVLTSPDKFLLFIKFAFEVPPKIGTGRAYRRLVKHWYLKKTALELAEIAAAKPRYRGWSHASVISLGHISTKDKGKAAVLKFLKAGIEKTKQEFGQEQEAEEVISYLETVSSFRKLTDPLAAASKIECYMLGIEHVNSRLVTNKEVWHALLRAMPLATLLDHMKFLTKRRMLRYGATWDFDFIKSISDALGNPAKISDSKIHPSRVYIEMYTYIVAARLKLDLSVKLHSKPPKQAPALSPELLRGFERLLKASYKNIESNNLSYVIGIDVNEMMQTRRCGYSRHVATGKAACLIALVTLKGSKSTDILAFGPNCVQPVAIQDETTVDELWSALHSEQVPSGPVDPQLLFNWAITQKKKADVFIILTMLTKVAPIVDELNKYALAVEAPNTRLIVCNLSGTPKQQTVINAPNVLTVSGFDDKVCKVIESFSNGAF